VGQFQVETFEFYSRAKDEMASYNTVTNFSMEEYFYDFSASINFLIKLMCRFDAKSGKNYNNLG